MDITSQITYDFPYNGSLKSSVDYYQIRHYQSQQDFGHTYQPVSNLAYHLPNKKSRLQRLQQYQVFRHDQVTRQFSFPSDVGSSIEDVWVDRVISYSAAANQHHQLSNKIQMDKIFLNKTQNIQLILCYRNPNCVVLGYFPWLSISLIPLFLVIIILCRCTWMLFLLWRIVTMVENDIVNDKPLVIISSSLNVKRLLSRFL